MLDTRRQWGNILIPLYQYSGDNKPQDGFHVARNNKDYETQFLPSMTFFNYRNEYVLIQKLENIKQRNWVFATNSNILIPRALQPDGVHF